MRGRTEQRNGIEHMGREKEELSFRLVQILVLWTSSQRDQNTLGNIGQELRREMNLEFISPQMVTKVMENEVT